MSNHPAEIQTHNWYWINSLLNWKAWTYASLFSFLASQAWDAITSMHVSWDYGYRFLRYMEFVHLLKSCHLVASTAFLGTWMPGYWRLCQSFIHRKFLKFRLFLQGHLSKNICLNQRDKQLSDFIYHQYSLIWNYHLWDRHMGNLICNAK